MYFGYDKHLEHGVPWRQPRSGKQMQADPGYALKWYRLKREAESNPKLRRLIYALQDRGLRPREIVRAIEKMKR